MLYRHLITTHKLTGDITSGGSLVFTDSSQYFLDAIKTSAELFAWQSVYSGADPDVSYVWFAPQNKAINIGFYADGADGLWAPWLTFSVPQSGAILFASDVAMGFQANTDFDDYIQFQTFSHVPEILTVGDCSLKITASNGRIGMGLTPTANMAGLSIEAGLLTLKETTTPTADTNYGKIYTKTDNKLYFQDGAGNEHEIQYV